MSHSMPPVSDESGEPRRKAYPNLPAGLSADSIPFLSRNAIYEHIGQVTQHALVECAHSIAQADCFGCGVNHALRGLVVLMRGPEATVR